MASERKNALEDIGESGDEPVALTKSSKKQPNGKASGNIAGKPANGNGESRSDSGEESSASAKSPNGESTGQTDDDAAIGPEEAELLRVLEELSDTIDTAHQALDEQQRLVSDVESDPSNIPGPPPDALPAPEPPPAPPASRGSGRRTFGSVFGATVGSCIGAAAIAALWIYWQAGPERTAQKEPAVERLAARSDASPRADADSRLPADSARVDAADGPPELWKNDAAPEPNAPPPAPQATKPDNPAASASTDVASTATTVVRPPAKQVTAPNVPTSAPDLPPPVPELPALDKGEEASILRRGTNLVASGDFASARLIFEFAAARQSAAAMYALARTYDPQALAETGAVGIQPDMTMALKWYGEAAGNGHKAASDRLEEIKATAARR